MFVVKFPVVVAVVYVATYLVNKDGYKFGPLIGHLFSLNATMKSIKVTD